MPIVNRKLINDLPVRLSFYLLAACGGCLLTACEHLSKPSKPTKLETRYSFWKEMEDPSCRWVKQLEVSLCENPDGTGRVNYYDGFLVDGLLGRRKTFRTECFECVVPREAVECLQAQPFMASLSAAKTLGGSIQPGNISGSITINGQMWPLSCLPERGMAEQIHKALLQLAKESRNYACNHRVIHKTIQGDDQSAQLVVFDDIKKQPEKFDGKRIRLRGRCYRLDCTTQAIGEGNDLNSGRWIKIGGKSSYRPHVELQDGSWLEVEGTFESDLRSLVRITMARPILP